MTTKNKPWPDPNKSVICREPHVTTRSKLWPGLNTMCNMTGTTRDDIKTNRGLN